MAATTHELDLSEVIPSDWVDAGCESVWLAAYRAALSEDAMSGVRFIDLPPARAILTSGHLSYQTAEIEGRLVDGEITIRPEMRTTPPGVYTVIVTPYDYAGRPGEEPVVRATITTAAGLLAAVNGGALAFEFVFENIVELASGNVSGFSPTERTPIAFGAPRVEAADLALTDEVAEALGRADEATQTKVRLALHWFGESLGEQDPRNEFIALWVALEALAMDTTNVKSINEQLAIAYGLSVEDAATRFGVGKMQGFRSRILHQGERLPVHGDLVNYCRALFADLLFICLGVPAQKRAEDFINKPTFAPPFDLDSLLHLR